jgi:hypothetical protein
MKKTIIALCVSAATVFGLTACRDAQVVSENLSRSADMFEVTRRVVFYNGITDKYIMTLEGLCSIRADRADRQLEVTCKTGPTDYKKHFLGISDNVTYFVEQLEPKKESAYHYRVVFKPQTIIPDIDSRGNSRELLDVSPAPLN